MFDRPYEPKPLGLVDFLGRDGKKTELDRVVDRLALRVWVQQGHGTHNIAVSRWAREGDWVHAELYRISLFEGEIQGTVAFPAELLDAERDGREPAVKPTVALIHAHNINPTNPFVQGCWRHFERKGWLSAGQIAALMNVDARRDVIPRRKHRR